MHDKLIQLDGNDTFSESEFLFDSSSDSSVMSSLGLWFGVGPKLHFRTWVWQNCQGSGDGVITVE